MLVATVIVTIGRIVGIVLALYFVYWLGEKIKRLMGTPTMDEQFEEILAEKEAKAKAKAEKNFERDV